MPTLTHDALAPGRAYRTRDLRKWSANPTRLAKRLVRAGRLRQAAHGLYYAPLPSRFGPAPPDETELLRAFFTDSSFLVSGPPRWNALGLGTTATFAKTLVYNTKRTGEFELDGRRFLLRRVLFPPSPPEEYFVVDLLEHHGMAGMALTDLEHGLRGALNTGRFETQRLLEMATDFGTKATLARIESALDAARRST